MRRPTFILCQLGLVKDREAALLKAAEDGHNGMVKLLLRKRADVATKDNHGRTALHLAASGGHLSLVQLLLEKGSDIVTKNRSLVLYPPRAKWALKSERITSVE